MKLIVSCSASIYTGKVIHIYSPVMKLLEMILKASHSEYANHLCVYRASDVSLVFLSRSIQHKFNKILKEIAFPSMLPKVIPSNIKAGDNKNK